jgi:hypothetical protein
MSHLTKQHTKGAPFADTYSALRSFLILRAPVIQLAGHLSIDRAREIRDEYEAAEANELELQAN